MVERSDASYKKTLNTRIAQIDSHGTPMPVKTPINF